MLEKPKASLTLGLDISANSLKGAQLAYKNRVPQILHLFSAEIQQKNDVKQLYMQKGKRQFASAKRKSLIVSTIPTRKTLVRKAYVDLVKEKDIDAVLEFQAEPLLPYPIAEAVVDRILIEKSKEKTKLSIISTKKDHISQHLDLCHSLQIEPETITCAPQALAEFSRVFCQETSPLILLNFGESEISCLLIQEGNLLAAQAIKSGTDFWAACLAEDQKLAKSEADLNLMDLDFLKLSNDQHPTLIKHFDKLRLEITRLIYALRKHAQGNASDLIMFSGRGALMTNVKEALCQSVQYETKEFDCQGGISQEDASLFASAIGAALTALPASYGQLNFRQKEFSYPNPWKRLKKPMAAYFLSCGFLILALYLLSFVYISKKEEALKNDYLNLLSMFDKSSELPTEFDPKTMQENLAKLEREIKKTPDIFPLFPNVPRVSDVLAWLSNHPHIVGNGPGETNPRIQLKSFSYKMVKKPESSKQKEKYQVKVEVEFTSPKPRYARELHDLLILPNTFLDPASEVKWNSERGKYRASFILKDKTHYP